jgi:hypothetical protein
MNVDEFRLLIERGDVDGIRRAPESEAALANRTIRDMHELLHQYCA